MKSREQKLITKKCVTMHTNHFFKTLSNETF